MAGGFGGGSFGSGGNGGNGFGGNGGNGGNGNGNGRWHGANGGTSGGFRHPAGQTGGLGNNFYGRGFLGAPSSSRLVDFLGFFLKVLFVPILLFAVASTALGGAITEFVKGGSFRYDDALFSSYADTAYSEAFQSGTAKDRDGLLVVILVNEERDGYYAIARLGDNVRREIRDMFGDEHTAFGRAMIDTIRTENYEHSLGKSLAIVIDKMKKIIIEMNYPSPFVIDGSGNAREPFVDNRTELLFADGSLAVSLDAFCEKTGISAVILVEDVDDVFEKSISPWSIIAFVLGASAFSLAVFLLRYSMKKHSAKKRDEEGEENFNKENKTAKNANK